MNSILTISRSDAAFLQKCGISLDEDCEFAPEDEMEFGREIHKLTERALASEAERLQRRGLHSAYWCYACGGKTRTRQIDFPWLRYLSAHRGCESCLDDIQTVGRDVFEIFHFPISARADSRRREAAKVLYRAARELAGGDNYDPSEDGLRWRQLCDRADKFDDLGPVARASDKVPSLCFFLAQADADDDSEADYQYKVIAAFQKSRFLQFTELRRAIEQQRHESVLRATRRALRMLGKPAVQAITQRIAAGDFATRDDIERLVAAAIAKATKHVSR
ncbi:MAG: hypothetical protein ACRD8A_15435 [Candidatus Acidiferrales bacterium]